MKDYNRMNPAQKVQFLERQLLEMEQLVQRLRDNANWMKSYTLEQSQEIACMALNEEYGFGEIRLTRFCEAYRRKWMDIANEAEVENATTALQGDGLAEEEEIPVTLEHMEREMQRLFNGHIPPLEERYSEASLGAWVKDRKAQLARDMETRRAVLEAKARKILKRAK